MIFRKVDGISVSFFPWKICWIPWQIPVQHIYWNSEGTL